MKPSRILTRLCILLSVLILRLSAAESPAALEEYIQFLRVHAGYEKFLGIRDDFRERLSQDLRGILIRRILEEPNLKGIAFTNFDAAPEQFQYLVLAEFINDDSQWSRDGGMSYTPTGVPDEVIKRLPPEGWIDNQSLQLALENKKQRKAIGATLRQLFDDMEKLPDEKDVFKNTAKERIVEIARNSSDRANARIPNKSNSLSGDNSPISPPTNSVDVGLAPPIKDASPLEPKAMRFGLFIAGLVFLVLICVSWMIFKKQRKSW
jgi:hypothetical protein